MAEISKKVVITIAILLILVIIYTIINSFFGERDISEDTPTALPGFPPPFTDFSKTLHLDEPSAGECYNFVKETGQTAFCCGLGSSNLGYCDDTNADTNYRFIHINVEEELNKNQDYAAVCMYTNIINLRVGLVENADIRGLVHVRCLEASDNFFSPFADKSFLVSGYKGDVSAFVRVVSLTSYTDPESAVGDVYYGNYKELASWEEE